MPEYCQNKLCCTSILDRAGYTQNLPCPLSHFLFSRIPHFITSHYFCCFDVRGKIILYGKSVTDLLANYG